MQNFWRASTTLQQDSINRTVTLTLYDHHRGPTLKVKDCTPNWPPMSSRFGLNIPTPDLDDTVLSARGLIAARDHVRLRLRSVRGTEYTTTVQLPDEIVEQLILRVTAQKDLTLRELGEL